MSEICDIVQMAIIAPSAGVLMVIEGVVAQLISSSLAGPDVGAGTGLPITLDTQQQALSSQNRPTRVMLRTHRATLKAELKWPPRNSATKNQQKRFDRIIGVRGAGVRATNGCSANRRRIWRAPQS